MRLTCPNCSARYEVDPSLIPAAGRDVQCSNCATTWFQPGPRSQSEPIVPAPEPEPDTPDEVVAPAAPPEPPQPEPQPGPPQRPRPERREIDPQVADILREEAEREARLRRSDASQATVETQGEMALEASLSSARALRGAAAFVEDHPKAPDVYTEDPDMDLDPISDSEYPGNPGAPRRELLPDIEEINSTLRATSDRKAGELNAADQDVRTSADVRRSQVRWGFFTVIFLAILAYLAYTQAPRIVEVVPQAAPFLERYIDIVNEGRYWLDGVVRDFLEDDG